MYTLWNGLKCKYIHSIHTHTALHHPSPPQAPAFPPPQARHLHPPPCRSPLWPFPTHHQTTAGESKLTQTEVRLSAACHTIVPEPLMQHTQFTILCDEYEPNSSWLQYVYCYILFSCSCYCIVYSLAGVTQQVQWPLWSVVVSHPVALRRTPFQDLRHSWRPSWLL